jgi:TfoX/Sxy family transcriptional regulator of competence genes
MFGGVAFMVNGNMSVGVLGPDLIVRIDPAETNAALLEPGVRPFDITGKAMKGWVFVAPEAVAANKQLHSWVRRGLDWARSLPPK